jgi:hypothetical protein
MLVREGKRKIRHVTSIAFTTTSERLSRTSSVPSTTRLSYSVTCISGDGPIANHVPYLDIHRHHADLDADISSNLLRLTSPDFVQNRCPHEHGVVKMRPIDRPSNLDQAPCYRCNNKLGFVGMGPVVYVSLRSWRTAASYPFPLLLKSAQ